MKLPGITCDWDRNYWKRKVWLPVKLAVLFIIVIALNGFLLFSGCNSVQSIGVTGSYGNDTVSVGVTILFKEAPAADTVAELKAANAIRVRSIPQEVWVMDYNVENKSQAKAVETSLRDGATVERIE